MPPRKKPADDPSAWNGKRTVVRLTSKCGWCNTGEHENCNHQQAWYDKLWICGCSCNSEWEPIESSEEE